MLILGPQHFTRSPDGVAKMTTEQMDPFTLKALKVSILHWEENLAHVKAGDWLDIKIGRSSCALCTRFILDCRTSCRVSEMCPVFKSTNADSCKGTPHEDVADFYTSLGRDSYGNIWYRRPDYFSRGCIPFQLLLETACQLEVDFLKSLLPPTSV